MKKTIIILFIAVIVLFVVGYFIENSQITIQQCRELIPQKGADVPKECYEQLSIEEFTSLIPDDKKAASTEDGYDASVWKNAP